MGKYLRGRSRAGLACNGNGQGLLFAPPQPMATPDRIALERVHQAAIRRRKARRERLAVRALATADEAGFFVLAAMLSQSWALDRVLVLWRDEQLYPSDWPNILLSSIVETALSLADRGVQPTPPILSAELRRRGLLLFDEGLLDVLCKVGRDPEAQVDAAQFEKWMQSLSLARRHVKQSPKGPDAAHPPDQARELSLLYTPINALESLPLESLPHAQHLQDLPPMRMGLKVVGRKD